MERQRPVTPPPMIAMGTDMGEDILGRVPAVDVIATATVVTQLKAEIDMVLVGYLSGLIVIRDHIYIRSYSWKSRVVSHRPNRIHLNFS
jgi:hypothetical protein